MIAAPSRFGLTNERKRETASACAGAAPNDRMITLETGNA
jgi:hypothetical protein